MLALQSKHIRIVQSKFAKANPLKIQKKGEGRSLFRHFPIKLLKHRISVESHGGLEIVDFDVVNATILIVLFNLTYKN